MKLNIFQAVLGFSGIWHLRFKWKINVQLSLGVHDFGVGNVLNIEVLLHSKFVIRYFAFKLMKKTLHQSTYNDPKITNFQPATS